VLLVFGAPCQLRLLAGQEHGRTIPLADVVYDYKVASCGRVAATSVDSVLECRRSRSKRVLANEAIGRACTAISRAVPAGPQAKSCVGQALVWLAILLSVSSAPSSPVCSFRDLVNILVQGSLLKSCCHRRRHFAPSHHEVGQSARALVVAPKKAAAIVGPCGTY